MKYSDDEVGGTLQFYIATHNRPELLLECLGTVLRQTEPTTTEIIVSDNSTNDDTKLILKDYLGKITYIKRKPNLTPIDHFNKILQEASKEFLTIFHDDDLLLPGYMSKLSRKLDQNQELAAVCCNAFYTNKDQASLEKIRKTNSDEIIADQNIFVREYIKITDNNPPPFPGYMYRTSDIQGLSIKGSEGGKYSDLAFLLKICKNKPILWLHEPLMSYRVHDKNDTKTEEIRHRIKLARFIYKNTDIHPKSSEAREMQFLYWYRCIRDNNIGGRSKKIAISFVIKYLITKIVLSKRFWKKILNKVIRNANA